MGAICCLSTVLDVRKPWRQSTRPRRAAAWCGTAAAAPPSSASASTSSDTLGLFCSAKAGMSRPRKRRSRCERRSVASDVTPSSSTPRRSSTARASTP
eukprot:336255-Prymnesium_polylepis.1